jgi:hypothetical protein
VLRVDGVDGNGGATPLVDVVPLVCAEDADAGGGVADFRRTAARIQD